MMRIKTFILSVGLVFSFAGLSAQDEMNRRGDESSVAKALQKFRWDMNLGTAYSWASGYGGGMSYYAAPGFSYPVNNKISFHGGIVTGVMSSPSFFNPEEGSQKISSGYTSVYGTVAYHLNQNVVFYGTGVKNLASFGFPNTPFHAPAFDEFSFGSSIRLGNNVTIGASVHFREYNPFSHGYFSPLRE